MAGYWGEAFIGFALIFKAICGDRDFVNLALPLAHKPCSGFESLPSVILSSGVQGERKSPTASPRFRALGRHRPILDPEGKDRQHEFAAKTRRCRSAKALSPEIKQSRLDRAMAVVQVVQMWDSISLPGGWTESSDALLGQRVKTGF